MVYFSALVGETTPEEILLAERNAHLPMQCFLPMLADAEIEKLSAELSLAYGMALVTHAHEREVLVDQDSVEQTRLLQAARRQLERAVIALGRAAEAEREQLEKTTRFREIAFATRSAQKELSLATTFLAEAKARLR